MISERHRIFVAAAGYKTRLAKFQGRDHLVLPIVALVEGVIHAMNAEGPEFVSEDAFSRFPSGWNGRPVFSGHPLVNGVPVSGNIPEVLEEKRIGTVFNAAIKKHKLTMEAWLDTARCEELAPELLTRVKDGDAIEISIGVFVDVDETAGEFNGKRFLGSWSSIGPDHLALLLADDTGACSNSMGCGVRAAKGPTVKVKDLTLGAVFARVMAAFRGSQSADEMSDADLRKKLSEAVRALEPQFNWIETYYPVTSPNRVVYSVYLPSLAIPADGGMYSPGTTVLYERQFTLGENGVVTVNASAVEVEPVVYYEPVLMTEEPTDLAGKRHNRSDVQMIQNMHNHAVALGANCSPMDAIAPKTAGAPVAGTPTAPIINQTEADVTKCELTKFLETATEDQLKALTAVAEGKVEPKVDAKVEPKVDAKVEDTKVVDEPKVAKAPTFEEVLATAAPDIRAAIAEGQRVGNERKAATIKVLKDSGRCTFTDVQLNAMDQASLDALKTLAGAPKVAIDFSGQGGPKGQDGASAVPAPPDLGAAIRASRGQKA